MTVGFGTSWSNVAEGTEAFVDVELSEAPQRPLYILVKPTNVSTSTADYRIVGNPVFFAADQTTARLAIAAIADTADEDAEEFTLSFLTPPDGVEIRTDDNEVTVKIRDDPPLLSNLGKITDSTLLAYQRSLEEYFYWIRFTTGNHPGGYNLETIGILVSKPGVGTGVPADALGPLRVKLWPRDATTTFLNQTENSLLTLEPPSRALSGTEDFDLPSDFRLKPDTTYHVTFGYHWNPTSSDTQHVTFAATSSNSADSGKTPGFSVHGYDRPEVQFALIGKPLPVPAVTASFDPATVSVAEGDGVSLTVTLSDVNNRPLRLPIVVEHLGGASVSDYRDVPDELYFAVGETTKTFTMRVRADALDDDGESLRIGFGELPWRVLAGDSAVLSIDNGTDVEVSFLQDTYSFREDDDWVGRPDSVQVRLGLNGVPGREVEVPIAVTHQGGATQADYSGVPETVRFGPNDTMQSFTVRSRDDSELDHGESLLLSLGPLPAGMAAGTPSTATVSIEDNELPAPRISFAPGPYRVDEGGTVQVTLEMTMPPRKRIVVPLIALTQDGATGDDFDVPDSVTFQPDQATAGFTLSLRENDASMFVKC